MSGRQQGEIEREITALVRSAKHLGTRREREQSAARLHKLIAERSIVTIAVHDAHCLRGSFRVYGRPEMRPDRIAAEAYTWDTKDRQHRARKGFAFGIASNGRAPR